MTPASPTRSSATARARTRAKFNAPLLFALALLGVASIWGVLFFFFPVTNDAYHPAFRAIEMDRCVSNGQPLAEWSPDLYSGRGSPLFQYYGPLPTWVAVFFHRALGVGSNGTVNAATLFFLFLGFAGVYKLSRRWFNPAASALAAAAFALSPYLVLDAFTRGALAELAGISFLPWILLGIERTLDEPASPSFTRNARNWILLPLSIAGLALSHPPTTLLAGVAFAAYAIYRSTRKRRATPLPFSLVAGVLLGLGLSAAYWLPAILQTSWIRLDDLAWADFSSFLLNPIVALFAPIVLTDKVTPLAFGIIPLLLTLCGYWAHRRAAHEKANTKSNPSSASHVPVGAWFLITLAAVFLSTSLSAFLWALVPQLRVIQFGWRTLAVASVFAALCAAAFFERVTDWVAARAAATRPASARLVPAATLFISLLLALSVFFWTGNHLVHASEFAFTPQALQDSGAAATYRDEYAPAGFALGHLTFSTPLHALGPGAPEVIIDSFRQTCTTFDTSFTNPPGGGGGNVALRLFSFPFWRATLDGQPEPLDATLDGLVQLDSVPVGAHVLHVEFSPTPWQQFARVLSLVSLVFLLVIGLSAFSPKPDSVKTLKRPK